MPPVTSLQSWPHRTQSLCFSHFDVFRVDLLLVRKMCSGADQSLVFLLHLSNSSLQCLKGVCIDIVGTLFLLPCLGT